MDRVDYQQLLVQDIRNLNESDELNYSPWYQRRSVWSVPQQSYLINTLHEQKPIPTIYMRYSLNFERGKTVREVVDGQQRIRAILSYCKDGFSSYHPETGERRTLSQLTRVQRERFLLTSIPIGLLLGATDTDVIDIFGRINSVSKNLNAQEKRNSRYSGAFKQFSLNQAASRVDFWRNYNIFTANDIARMLEVQFISDLALNLMWGLSDFSPKKLDETYKKFDDDFPQAGDIVARIDRLFDFLVDLDSSTIRDTLFNRQPVFFSLLLGLDSLNRLDSFRVEVSLHEIDTRYHLDNSQMTAADRQFHTASTATTQRLRQRQIRHKYIKEFLG